ncbi:MAG: fatty-acid--CoA ligase, partial [Meiothermus sp.]
MQTIVGRIERATEQGGAVTFVSGSRAERVPWAQLYDEAVAMATALQSRGAGPGSHVALLGPTTRELVTAIEGVWLAGATLVVLPLPMR